MGAIRTMWLNLLDGWQVKSLVGFCLAIGTNSHFTLLLSFVALVVLDLISKQLALSAKYLADTYKRDITTIDTYDKIVGILPAIEAGYIKSFFMRRQFLTKMATYFFAVVGAKLCDFMILSVQEPFLLNMVYGYLGATELLSIFENLRDGGNKTVGALLHLINEKLGGRFK